MKPSFRRACAIAATTLGVSAWSLAAGAQQTQTVGGLVVNLGIVPAEVALLADGHHQAHPLHPPPGSQHLLVTLDSQQGHQRIADAEVLVDITDPHGHVERKPLLHTHSAGLADYSELFEFGWSGEYRVHAVIVPHGGGKPVETRFTVHHVI